MEVGLMADDKNKDHEEKPSRDEEEDSTLGNLPPLSDFDSRGGFDSDGGLPPLRDTESGSGQQQGSGGDSASFGFASDSFSSGTSDQQSGGSGFQDFAADSDFSPETPSVG